MATTALGLAGVPQKPNSFADKAEAGLPPIGVLIDQFDVWIESYAGAIVSVYRAGTTELATLYLDEQLTQKTTNPQVLLSRADPDGVEFGKFARSLYTPYAYELDINTTEQTGTKRPPVVNLAGQDASFAHVVTKGGSRERALRERFADFIVTLDYGAITNSAATNAATLQLAIAAASTQGGGEVQLPAGVIVSNPIAVPTGVLLRGKGRGVTILQMQSAGNNITVSGDNAGLADLTVDGINLAGNSVGVFGKARSRLLAYDVEVKRFHTNWLMRGGRDHVYRDLYVSDAANCIRLLGDADFVGGGDGDEFSGLDWIGGRVEIATTVGLDLAVVDMPVRQNTVRMVDILDCAGNSNAVFLYGAGWTSFESCFWEGNTTNIKAQDNPDTTLSDRTCVSLRVFAGQMDGGKLQLDGECQDFVLDRVEIIGVTFELVVPVNPLLLRDCVETNTLATGETQQLTRFTTVDQGTVKGATSTTGATVAWKRKLKPNEIVLVSAKVTAEQRNGVSYAAWHIQQAARCGPLVLPYDNQSSNFTTGNLVTGQTSGASGTIVAQSDSGTSGTTSLADVGGTFVDDELLVESGGTGNGQVNGAATAGTVSMIGSAEAMMTAVGSNTGSPPASWAPAFAASGQEVQITVTGAAATNIVWNLDVSITRL